MGNMGFLTLRSTPAVRISSLKQRGSGCSPRFTLGMNLKYYAPLRSYKSAASMAYSAAVSNCDLLFKKPRCCGR